MRSLSILLTVAILLYSSYSAVYPDIAIVGPFSSAAFNCLSTLIDPGMYVFVRGYHSVYKPAGIDVNGEATMLNAARAGLYAQFYTEICRGLDPIAHVNSMVTFFKSVRDSHTALPFLNGLMVKFVESENPSCSWNGYTHKQNCDFITAAMNAIGSDLQGTVFTTPKFWADRLGVECADLASGDFTLTYANYQSNGRVNSTLNYNDFIPFGGWSKSKANIYSKQTSGNKTIPLTCLTYGSITPTARIDIYHEM